MGPFGSLRGHHSLQTASEFKSYLRFAISDLNFIGKQSFGYLNYSNILNVGRWK